MSSISPIANRMTSPFYRALSDLLSGLMRYQLWLMLGWQDIKQRYRRSILGPLWLTLSTGIMIAAMGPLYGRLFGHSISEYVPYLAASLISWQLISGILSDSCQVFIAAEGHIKQTRLPLSIFIYRAVWRNVIIFAHNLVILVIICFLLPVNVNSLTLLVFVGLLLLMGNAVWVGLLLGMLCARFRDIPPIIASVITIAFFLTPILWKAEALGSNAWLAKINPMFHIIEIIRTPLLGQSATLLSWGVASLIFAVGLSITIIFFSRYRARVAYWL